MVILNAEDGVADGIAPKVQRQGGDASRIHVFKAIDCGEDGERMFSLDGDIKFLDRAIAEIGNVHMVIIDPISAYCGNKDSYKDAEVRKLLSPLSSLAEKHGVSILGIGHFTKDSNRKAMYRGIGSIAFVAAARTGFAVARDPEDSEGRRCLLMPIKSNIGPLPSTYTFEIDDSGKLVWGEERQGVDADSVLSASGRSGKVEARPFAEDFLRDLLKDGEVLASEIERRAKGEGIAKRTLDRAKKELGVKSRREGQTGAKNQRWVWFLPESERKAVIPDNLVPFEDRPREKPEPDEPPSLETQLEALGLW